MLVRRGHNERGYCRQHAGLRVGASNREDKRSHRGCRSGVPHSVGRRDDQESEEWRWRRTSDANGSGHWQTYVIVNIIHVHKRNLKQQARNSQTTRRPNGFESYGVDRGYAKIINAIQCWLSHLAGLSLHFDSFCIFFCFFSMLRIKHAFLNTVSRATGGERVIFDDCRRIIST